MENTRLPSESTGEVFPVVLDSSSGRVRATGAALSASRLRIIEALLDDDCVVRQDWVEVPNGRRYCEQICFEPSSHFGYAYVSHGSTDPLSESSERWLTQLTRTLRTLHHAIEGPVADDRMSVKSHFVEPTLRVLPADQAGIEMPRHAEYPWQSFKSATRVLLTGHAGVGKTTSLRRLAYELSESLKIGDEHQVPVFVSLRQFDDRDLDFPATMRSALGGLAAPSEVVASDSVQFVFLFDGLDEVRPSQIDRVTSQIRRLTQDHPRARVFVTCRSQSYRGWFDDFDSVQVDRWSSGQILNWSKHYFAAQAGSVQLGRFVDAVLSSAATQDLLSTPLHLALAAALYRREDLVPSSQADLARLLVDWILQDWDRSRGVARVDDATETAGIRRQLLQRLAIATELSESKSVPLDAVSNAVAAELGVLEIESVVEQLRHWTDILVVTDGVVSFRHQLFAQALVADWIARSFGPATEELGRLSPSGLQGVLANLVRVVPDASSLLEWIDRSLDWTSWSGVRFACALFAEPTALPRPLEQDRLAALLLSIGEKLREAEESEPDLLQLNYHVAPTLRVPVGSRAVWRSWTVDVEDDDVDDAIAALQVFGGMAGSRLRAAAASLQLRGDALPSCVLDLIEADRAVASANSLGSVRFTTCHPVEDGAGSSGGADRQLYE